MHSRFENDVKIYGIQTIMKILQKQHLFENDVKIYGIQTEVFDNVVD